MFQHGTSHEIRDCFEKLLQNREHPIAQTQSQKQRGQQGTSLNTATQQGDEADQGRQQGGRGELPKQQNQDPSRRSGPETINRTTRKIIKRQSVTFLACCLKIVAQAKSPRAHRSHRWLLDDRANLGFFSNLDCDPQYRRFWFSD